MLLGYFIIIDPYKSTCSFHYILDPNNMIICRGGRNQHPKSDIFRTKIQEAELKPGRRKKMEGGRMAKLKWILMFLILKVAGC